MTVKKEFKIEKMTCAMCQSNVQKIASSQEGVLKAEVFLESKTLKVNIDEDFDEEKLAKAIGDAGYQMLQTNEFEIYIDDMDCPSCLAGIEASLMSREGIEKVSGNVNMKTLQVSYQRDLLNEPMIVQMVEDMGYHVGPTVQKDERKQIVFELVLAFLMMLISMGPMISPQLHKLFSGYERWNAHIQLLIAVIVLGIHHQTLTRGFRLLWKKMPNMDSLVAMGSGSAFLFSLYHYILFVSGNESSFHHLYFESFVVILVFISVGRYLENKSKEETHSALNQLARLQPKTALVLRNGVEEELPSYLIQVGDHLVLKAGMRVPSDGEIIEGSASFDESILTGESMPLDKTVDDHVYSGTLVSSGYVVYESRKNVAQSSLSSMLDAVEKAQMEKSPIARLADKVASVFVPTVLVIASISLFLDVL